MATRTIVTSQPDVACDVCERRLLRGEQPDVFIAAGRRRIVCELCAPRAANEGWLRERDTQSMVLPATRQRRRRTLLDRLRPGARPAAGAGAQDDQPYDFLEAPAAGAKPVPAVAASRGEEQEWAELDGAAGAAEEPEAMAPASDLELAVAVFNNSEFPRRVAGVARSLGAPEVSVRRAEHLHSLVEIVVAWELCWYRYEVDLGEAEVEVRVAAQGTELSELHRDDRLANAMAADSGVMLLAAG